MGPVGGDVRGYKISFPSGDANVRVWIAAVCFMLVYTVTSLRIMLRWMLIHTTEMSGDDFFNSTYVLVHLCIIVYLELNLFAFLVDSRTSDS